MIEKKITKTLRIVIVCMLVVSLASGMAFAATPSDVAGTAQERAITLLIEAGVVMGDPDGRFRPLDNLTRAEACAMIVRALDPPSADLVGTLTQTVPASGFPDMEGHWAERYVGYAVRNGIVVGFPDGTFRPGDNVRSNEMLTMVLRAVGITNEEIGLNWPADFIARADREGILQGLGATLPEFATREIAARMVYNKLTEMRAIGTDRHKEEPIVIDESRPAVGNVPWNVNDLNFRIGRFDGNLTTFAGMPISPDVEVFTYGLRATFNRSIELPTRIGEYRQDTIHKFRNTNSPALYVMTDGEITLMILPMDVGFTGNIYGVINGTATVTNARGEQVNSIHTLVAGRHISWLTNNSGINAPAADDFLDGQVFQINSRNGMVTANPMRPGDAGSNSDFRELTSGSWEVVESIANYIITLDDGSMFTATSDAVVYVLNTDGQSYRVGRLGDIRAESEIRAFTLARGEIAQLITVRNR